MTLKNWLKSGGNQIMKSGNTLRQALIICAISLAVAGCDQSPRAGQNKIDKIAAEMQAQLPKMLDSDTKLVTVYTKNLELVSEYELVNYPVEVSDQARLKGKIENYLKRQVCPGIKSELLSKGISSHYIYKGKNDAVVLDLVLAPGDC
jgi:hypothetical protein